MTNIENEQMEATNETEIKPAEEEKPEEAKSDLMITFTVEVSKETVEKDFDEALIKYANEIKLPGFRQGKTPIDVIKNRFSDAIKDEVINKVLEKAVFEKIEKDKIKIASQPQVDKLEYKDGEDLKAEVTVEVFPTLELPGLETIEIEIPSAELKYEEYDEQKQIDALLEGNRRQSPVVDREIMENDYVMLKYQSKILETKRMTPQKQAYFIVNEKEEFEIPGLYKEIIGKKKDDTFTITHTYPADYKKKPWAGKEIEHHIVILSIFEMVKPELNEVFLKSMGFDDEAVFKNKLKEEYEQHNQKTVEDKKFKHIVDKLVETVPFSVPQSAVNEEAHHILSHYQKQFNFPMDMNNPALLEPLKKDAEKAVRSSLIFDAVKKKYNLEVTTDELENEYKNIAEKNHVPIKEVRKFYMSKENSSHLKEDILRVKIVNVMKEKVIVKEI